MPLYEYECVKCRNKLDRTLKSLRKNPDKKTADDALKKYDNINSIEVADLDKEKLIVQTGKRDKNCPDYDFYYDEGSMMIMLNMQRYRFSHLVYEEADENNVKCPYCGEKKKVEKVVSSFSFTSDLSTDMPKPDMSGLPPDVRNKMFVTDYIEEKDRPKQNR